MISDRDLVTDEDAERFSDHPTFRENRLLWTRRTCVEMLEEVVQDAECGYDPDAIPAGAQGALRSILDDARPLLAQLHGTQK